MAYIRKRGKRWHAEVYRGEKREFDSFATKAEASAWALERESMLSGDRLPQHTLAEAMERYANTVSDTKKGGRWEKIRFAKLKLYDVAKIPLPQLTATHIAAWRDLRLTEVKPGTVYREMNAISAVLSKARKEWRWIDETPTRDVERPTQPPSRRRRISEDEIARLCSALGYEFPNRPANLSQRVALAFLFALETAMRAGEILGLTPPDVHVDQSYVTLPKTKNGDIRHVPLSKRAIKILRLLPPNVVPVFGIEPALRDALFRKARRRAGLDDLHFHDARAEAIWRMSKKIDVLQLARVIGHRDINSLRFYYNESATEIAKRLG